MRKLKIKSFSSYVFHVFLFHIALNTKYAKNNLQYVNPESLKVFIKVLHLNYFLCIIIKNKGNKIKNESTFKLLLNLEANII